MLQYIRKSEMISQTVYSTNMINSEVEFDHNPMLTYCNWNYGKEYHLTSKSLKLIIQKFDITKIPYYVRIFNEIPIQTIHYFIDSNDLVDNDLKNIWLKVSTFRGVRLQSDFWKKYNTLRI